MSTKKKLTPRPSNLPNSTSKITPKVSTLKSSTPKSRPKVVKNLSETTSLSTLALNSTTITDPTHSQKYMQHKLDMAYNKYLQTLALNTSLSKMHKESEKSIDEQLVHYEELHENALEEEQTKKNLLKDMNIVYETECKIKTLETCFEKITNFIEDKNVIKKIKELNESLHFICDKIIFENMNFVTSEENYSKLQQTLEEISTALNEINSGSNEEFLLLADNIFKIKDLLIKLRKNHEIIKSYQYDINNLTLRAASIELLKPIENITK